MSIDIKMQIFMEFVKSSPVQVIGLGASFSQEFFITVVETHGSGRYPGNVLAHAFEYFVASGFIKKSSILLAGKEVYQIDGNISRLLEYLNNPIQVVEDYRD